MDKVLLGRETLASRSDMSDMYVMHARQAGRQAGRHKAYTHSMSSAQEKQSPNGPSGMKREYIGGQPGWSWVGRWR